MRSKLPNVGTTIFTEMSGLAAQHDAINLSQGFPNFNPDIRLQNLVSKQMKEGYNQYAPMAGVVELREVIAEKIKFLYDVAVDPQSEINITAGGTQAIFTAITAFIHSGDEVLVVEPAFDCYNPAIQLAGGKVIPFELNPPDFAIDWKKFEDSITHKTRMIIINTPHNPTGSILKHEDVLQLSKIVENRDLVVLSDEVYEHLIFDGEEHCSILKYSHLRHKAIAVFSFGKTFHCTGWKIGYAVMPPQMMKEFRKVHQFNVFSVNSFVQHGIADYLSDRSTYMKLPDFYQERRDLLAEFLAESPFKMLPSKGSYFVLCDYSAISQSSDTEFAKWLTAEIGVACIPISVFYSSGRQDGYVRFCFAKTPEVLQEAGKLLQNL
ncbi:methionine aminotransferase [Portibacter marinus]|uniref:methionine aminotransferase n=1 Tax=Portibacter marinus TaxID=2898660 RepID=UPI001F25F74A|nr:methionine aminotransferase [Portibacter marinus]